MLTVVYDETCALCHRCRHWLEMQPTLVELEFVAAGSEEARRRYGGLPWLGAELVVASAAGEVWVGPAAFLMALWATEEFRPWSYRLSGRHFAPLAEWFFRTVSSKRRYLGFLGRDECPDGKCQRHPRKQWSVPTVSDV
jgi:predicted DCC family thiol-disulfide oxidoreductase YuxK